MLAKRKPREKKLIHSKSKKIQALNSWDSRQASRVDRQEDRPKGKQGKTMILTAINRRDK